MKKFLTVPFSPTMILVPVDFSESSRTELATAKDLAEHFHAKIHLLHVVTMMPITTGVEFPTTFYPAEELLEEVTNQAQVRLGEMISVLNGVGIEAASSVEVGIDIAGTILTAATREHADLLVISTHGMSGWHPLIFGSTAEKILRLVHVPLLLLRSVKPRADSTATQS